MDNRIVSQKIESLRNCIDRIKSKEPVSAHDLTTNFDIQDVISVNLERAIQNCIDIASHISCDFDEIGGLSSASIFLELASRQVITTNTANEIAKAVGFRNLLVHRYANIDWNMVHSYLNNNLISLKDFAKEVSIFSKL
jgi:uncharacterized protein YutE (UPF0331/DUF86 family)